MGPGRGRRQPGCGHPWIVVRISRTGTPAATRPPAQYRDADTKAELDDAALQRRHRDFLDATGMPASFAHWLGQEIADEFIEPNLDSATVQGSNRS